MITSNEIKEIYKTVKTFKEDVQELNHLQNAIYFSQTDKEIPLELYKGMDKYAIALEKRLELQINNFNNKIDMLNEQGEDLFVSFIVPDFNWAKYCDECLNSIDYCLKHMEQFYQKELKA